MRVFFFNMEISSHLRYENNDQLDFTVPSFFVFLAIRSRVFVHIIYLELCLVYMWIGSFACLFTLHMGYGNKPKNTSRWQRLERQGKFFPLEHPKGTSSADTWSLASSNRELIKNPTFQVFLYLEVGFCCNKYLNCGGSFRNG